LKPIYNKKKVKYIKKFIETKAPKRVNQMLLYKLHAPFLADYSDNKRLLVIILKN